MAKLKVEIARNPLKIAGGVLLLCGSVWLLFHRMPHHEYVAAHADVPRPKAAAAPQLPQRAPGASAAANLSGTRGRAVVDVSTSATVGGIYTAERLRDPFARWGANHGHARAFSLQDFSIHKLSLRGIMRDAGTDFALFVDNDAGVGCLLRKGRLYDPKKKVIPGVAGAIDFKRKTVTLTASEGDVQVFRLGEEEKD